MFLLIADPPTILPMGAVQLTELRPAYRVSVGVPFAHKQPSVLSMEGCFFVKTALGKKEMKIGMTTAMPDEMTKTVPPEQTEQDEEILRLIRELGYGKIVITVKNGQPVHAELQKSVLL